MSDEEIRLQAQLQLQQMQSNLEQSERELAQARRDVEESRRLIISLGQAFVPDVFAARAASGNSQTMPQIKTMKTGEIVGLIVQALGQRLSKLTAFTQGLTAEQQTQVLKHIFEKASSDWLDDPRVGEATARARQYRRPRLHVPR